MKFQIFVRIFFLVAFGIVYNSQAGILTGTFSPIMAGSNVDLTAAGKLDWAGRRPNRRQCRIDYTAVTNNQQLILVWHSLQLFDQVYGNVTLQAATLQSAAPLPVEILSPQRLDNGLAFSFQTQTNYTYSVQCTYSLQPPVWQALTSFPGNGAAMSVTNENTTSTTCFYRVLTE